MAALLSSAATSALAQQSPEPLPPAPVPTTVVEPIAAPDIAPPTSPPADPPKEEEDAEGPDHVPRDASGIDLSTLETNNLSLLYFDPVQTYLTPYIARAFENALIFHKKIFNWTPWDRTTLLLKDFGDYGNAAARSSPNNAVLLDIAPLSVSMETFSPGERFFTLTNHELTHVALMDVWNERDAFWRRFLGGKPMPVQEHPEIHPLQLPRHAAQPVPRWYLEGSAVFMETWMAGGFGRAQGAYDEMVFRAMVRDERQFYSPVGLESRRHRRSTSRSASTTTSTARASSPISALTYGPKKVVEWLRPRRRQRSHSTLPSSGACSTAGSTTRGTSGSRGSSSSRRSNLAKLSAYPLTEVAALAPSGLARSRAASSIPRPTAWSAPSAIRA